MKTKRVELCIVTDHVNMHKHLIGGCKEGAARLSQQYPVNGQRTAGTN